MDTAIGHPKSHTGVDSHKSRETSLAARINSYEASSETFLPRDQPFILRLDGRSFSKFSRRFLTIRPFDPRFVTAMRQTASDLVHEFSPVSAYV
jgi:tRNA(His) guanylyltransferase